MATADPQGDDTKCWWRLSLRWLCLEGCSRWGVGWRWGTAVQAPALERKRLRVRLSVPLSQQEDRRLTTPLPETRDNTKPPKV